MPKYLVTARYTPEGLRGLRKEGGTKRREAVSAALTALGGKLESFHFGMGKYDAIVILEAPDTATVAGLMIAIGASGSVSTRTVALLTPEEVDKAVKQPVSYRAPGSR